MPSYSASVDEAEIETVLFYYRIYNLYKNVHNHYLSRVSFPPRSESTLCTCMYVQKITINTYF